MTALDALPSDDAAPRPATTDARYEAATRLGARLPMRVTPRVRAAAYAALAECQRRATVRTLGESDVDYVIDVYRDAQRVARRAGLDPASVSVVRHGGRVPHAYGYAGESTWISIDCDGIHCVRERAESSPRASGWTTRAGVAASSERPLLRGLAPRASGPRICWYW